MENVPSGYGGEKPNHQSTGIINPQGRTIERYACICIQNKHQTLKCVYNQNPLNTKENLWFHHLKKHLNPWCSLKIRMVKMEGKNWRMIKETGIILKINLMCI